MDFRYRYVEIKITMVSGEVHIIKDRFGHNVDSNTIINYLTRDRFLYTNEGVWINSSLIEEFTYKAKVKKEREIKYEF